MSWKALLDLCLNTERHASVCEFLESCQVVFACENELSLQAQCYLASKISDHDFGYVYLGLIRMGIKIRLLS